MLSSIFVSFQDDPFGRPSIALVYSGCERGASGNPCPGCHNPELWCFGHGEADAETAENVRKSHLYSLSPDDGLSAIASVVVIGGEPFDQNMEEVCSDIDAFLERGRSAGTPLDVVVFTGYDSLEEACGETPVSLHPLVERANILKLGHYDGGIPPKAGSRLASGNQRFVEKKGSGRSVVFEEISFHEEDNR